MRFVVIALALGCTPGDVDVDMGDRYIYDENYDQVTADMSVAEVEAAMQEALGIARNYKSIVVLDAYNEMLNARADGCPNYYAGSTSSNWNDDCETSAGDSYSGYVYTGNGDTSWWLSAGAVIETVDGRRLEMAGTASAWRSESEWGISQSGSVKGTFKAKGGAASDTWLEEDYSPDLTVSSWWGVGDWGTKHITLQGVVGITAEKASIVSFDQVRSYGDVKGTVECSAEPSGIISVRSNQGYWYDVIFEGLGPDAGEEDVLAPEDCDGCGRLFFRGEYVGQACVDTAPVLDWDEMP